MACEQTAIIPTGTIPTLGCCASLDQTQYDVVFVLFKADITEPVFPNFSQADLDFVYQLCIDEPFTQGDIQLSVNRFRQVSRGPLLGVGAEACYVVPNIFLQQTPAHGMNLDQLSPDETQRRHDEIWYFAAKVRARLPAPRRICITSCAHVQDPSDCPGAGHTCDPAIGSEIRTLLPAANTVQVLPDRLQLLPQGAGGRNWPNFRRGDFAWKRFEIDSDPPGSPFCGLP